MSVVLPPLNRIISDESFLNTFGRLPNETDSEDLRISTHLKYVFNTLEKHQKTSTNEKIIQNRNVNLNYLKEYIQNSKFPKRTDNFESIERMPVFRDDFGTYCAVGYIMHKNGLDLENVINSDFNFGYLNNEFIDSFPELKQWINNCGFSVKELQCIQPTYNWRKRKFEKIQREKREKEKFPEPEVKEDTNPNSHILVLPTDNTEKKMIDKSDKKSQENEIDTITPTIKDSKNKESKKNTTKKENNKRPPKNKYDKTANKSNNKNNKSKTNENLSINKKSKTKN